MEPVSYILPLRVREKPSEEFVQYLNELAGFVEVVVVDGSDSVFFTALNDACVPAVRHIRPAPDLVQHKNGKVRGVLTGLRVITHESVIIADDDVRHSPSTISAMVAVLKTDDVIRPQNYFHPSPWHAHIDTARILINRVTGGDWPGTLGVRRSVMTRTNGYSGDVLFENLELVRTVLAAGGTAASRPDLFVRRLPPTTKHFWGQRIRQAYDEFARPYRLVAALMVVPFVTFAAWRWSLGPVLLGFACCAISVAELGRRREGGMSVFPLLASLCAPLWVIERGVCAWLAVAARVRNGGIRYNGHVLAVAAHSIRALELRRRKGDRELNIGSEGR
jgi:hypothetical protein